MYVYRICVFYKPHWNQCCLVDISVRASSGANHTVVSVRWWCAGCCVSKRYRGGKRFRSIDRLKSFEEKFTTQKRLVDTEVDYFDTSEIPGNGLQSLRFEI